LIEPNVVFGPGVKIGSNVTVRAFSHFEQAEIADGCQIGPYARLRPGAKLQEDVHIGNFVEVKNTTVERGAKANHLAYLGDGRVGAGSNIGAGTIFCNYDGYAKFFTDIEANVFIGSNSSLVAPVTIGNGAYVATGSVITESVPPDALAFGRARQTTLPGKGKQLRERRADAAAAKRKK
jgi:bifunctional UDP-N-acetylglucosamine pyrophosphorylase/glucosamine-1-phosphate N-acetyltransferase